MEAQIALPAISATRQDTIPHDPVKAWRVDSRMAVADSVPFDSVIVSYQDLNPVNSYSIASSWNGNLGSPLESKLFSHRFRKSHSMFSQAYNPYLITPEDVVYYNTKIPHSNLTYRTAFPTYREEDYLKTLITMNANKRVNVGALCNLIYGRGQYQRQASRLLNGGFWGVYNGTRYELNASIMFNQFRNQESGGLQDDIYIFDDDYNNIDARNMPVRLRSAQSDYRNYNYFLNHRYHIGREVERKVSEDSVAMEFQSVVTVFHSFLSEDIRRRYTEERGSLPELGTFYTYNHYNDGYTDDSTATWLIRNTVGVQLDEEFNRLLRFGLSAYVEYDVRHYGVAFDTIVTERSFFHDLKVGAVLSKNQGRYFKYNFNGKIYLVGPYIGSFDVNGDLRGDFNIAGEPVRVEAGAGFSSAPTFHLYENYHSNHFIWENNEFRNMLNLDIRGRLSLPKRDISVGVRFNNITGYTYLNHDCLPQQHDGNIQVLAVDLTANLRAWRFHLDTKAEYQLTSSREVLPLPDLALYSNLYYRDRFFHVLTVQLGVSVRYHTAYFANAYMPALGQFYLQNETVIGNYPEMNVYANFHLKTVNFYVQYYHWNRGLFPGVDNTQSMPFYPINPGTFQMGFSWNFWR